MLSSEAVVRPNRRAVKLVVVFLECFSAFRCRRELTESRPCGLGATSGGPLLPGAVMEHLPAAVVGRAPAPLPSAAESAMRIRAGWAMLHSLAERCKIKTVKMLHILLQTSRIPAAGKRSREWPIPQPSLLAQLPADPAMDSVHSRVTDLTPPPVSFLPKSQQNIRQAGGILPTAFWGVCKALGQEHLAGQLSF